ncbi:lytic transglycosylase domain-containing protein [Methylogaea oryzae]|nr:lytic transglycosylase domain-containing protein [Methylogaea oryzae]
MIPLLLLAACSTNPAAPKANGTSQTTLPRPPMPQASAPLIFPEDAQEPVHRSSELFPRPSEIEPQVRFWKKVYATWNRGQAAIHDKRHMNVVYEVVQIPGEAGDSLTAGQKEFVQARLDDWRRRLGDLESKLAAGAALSGEEQALVQRMAQISGDNGAIFGAAQRLRYQRGLRERFKSGLAIGARYDNQYKEIFRNAGLPEDLAYLPHVESSFQHNAHSSAGALGIWQFTAGAARMFMGNASAAARLDPIASTYGAARYLSHAYDKLGSWPLAVTSYNHGISGMLRAKDLFGHDFPRIVKEYDHPLFGFASRNYYAEFLAARDIASQPERFFPEGLSN